jgi:pimeloyl-ACP methyl ester carboxylesterase
MRQLGAVLAVLAGIVMATAPRPARADSQIGIVLMHGKSGTPMGGTEPGGRVNPIGAGLIGALRHAGYLVVTPEMCWSSRRDFDAPYPDCLREIDTAIGELRGHGANAIVVGGLSLGGNAALAYGATHPGLLGVIALSPADNPGPKLSHSPTAAASLANAQALVAQGKGDEPTTFSDANTGAQGGYATSLRTTPRIFVSFNGPDSLANIPATVARLTMPLLWVAGDRDPTQRAADRIFAGAPANPHNRFVVVHANHVEVPDAATSAALSWLAELRK